MTGPTVFIVCATDLTMVDARGKAIAWPGIYELQGDVLKWCAPFPFGMKLDNIDKRPTGFRTKPGGADVLEVYRREKK